MYIIFVITHMKFDHGEISSHYGMVNLINKDINCCLSVVTACSFVYQLVAGSVLENCTKISHDYTMNYHKKMLYHTTFCIIFG